MGIQSAKKLVTNTHIFSISIQFQTIMSSQAICCDCNVFTLAEIITVIEISLSFISFIGIETSFWNFWSFSQPSFLTLCGVFVIYWAYLATEYVGIHMKIRGLIIFNCVIRVILIVLLGIASIIFVIIMGFYGLMFTVPQ